MKGKRQYLILVFLVLLSLIIGMPAKGMILVQCPSDTNGDGISDDPNIVCLHLAAGDGFANMADGKTLYTFGFSLVPPGLPPNDVMWYTTLKADFPGPTITVKEGQELYLTVTNVGMMMRPDLFDAHSVHWHGFPNASTFFDGEPMASFGANMGASFTYYYNVPEPGTYMYHCHVEATEHMQMGMLANLYVTPIQDGTPKTYNGRTYTKFAYNDGDGSTGYDVAHPVQIHAFDPNFHEDNLNIQLSVDSFAYLFDRYGMINGRGYPDTINTAELGQSPDNDNYASQKVHSLITANRGERILLRISNLSFDFYTLTVLGIPMKVVGKDAKILRGPAGINLYYDTSSLNLGGGQAAEVILDTTNVDPGRYFLYTTNLNHLSNDGQERGGMMTEIVINP